MFDKKAKKHQENHIQKLLSRTTPEIVEIEGIKIKVNPDVFAPATDTKLLAKYIKVKPNLKILDLTTGSGILATIASKQGANVTAVDILPEAIKNSKENFKTLGLKIKTIQSDMFENIDIHDKFDLIFVNGPYFEGKITIPIEYASLDLNNFLEKLFSKLSDHLVNGGKLLMTFAEFGEIELFYNKLEKYNLLYTKIDSMTSRDGKRVYSLFEIKVNK